MESPKKGSPTSIVFGGCGYLSLLALLLLMACPYEQETEIYLIVKNITDLFTGYNLHPNVPEEYDVPASYVTGYNFVTMLANLPKSLESLNKFIATLRKREYYDLLPMWERLVTLVENADTQMTTKEMYPRIDELRQACESATQSVLQALGMNTKKLSQKTIPRAQAGRLRREWLRKVAEAMEVDIQVIEGTITTPVQPPSKEKPYYTVIVESDGETQTVQSDAFVAGLENPKKVPPKTSSEMLEKLYKSGRFYNNAPWLVLPEGQFSELPEKMKDKTVAVIGSGMLANDVLRWLQKISCTVIQFSKTPFDMKKSATGDLTKPSCTMKFESRHVNHVKLQDDGRIQLKYDDDDNEDDETKIRTVDYCFYLTGVQNVEDHPMLSSLRSIVFEMVEIDTFTRKDGDYECWKVRQLMQPLDSTFTGKLGTTILPKEALKYVKVSCKEHEFLMKGKPIHYLADLMNICNLLNPYYLACAAHAAAARRTFAFARPRSSRPLTKIKFM